MDGPFRTPCLSRVELVLAAELEVVLVDAPVLQVGAERHHAHLVKGRSLDRSMSDQVELLVGELYKSSAVK